MASETEDSESAISKFMSSLDTVQGGYARGVLGLALSGAKDNPFFALTPLGGMADLVRMPDDTAQRVRAGMQQDGIRGALTAADQAYHEADEAVPGVKFAMETPFDFDIVHGRRFGISGSQGGQSDCRAARRSQQSGGHRTQRRGHRRRALPGRTRQRLPVYKRKAAAVLRNRRAWTPLGQEHAGG